MATTDSFSLAPLAAADDASLAVLWPRSCTAITLQRVEPMHVLSLRHLPGGGASALSTALAGRPVPGLPSLPGPGEFRGVEPRLIWCSPSEFLMLTQDAALASSVLAELRPAPGALACALEVSAGTLVVKLQGAGVDALLSRLVDAQALPRATDRATRVRLADIAAVVWRDAPDHVGLLVDRVNAHYLALWLSDAAEAI